MPPDKTLPEASNPDHERYMVYGRTEILLLLRRLAERRAAVTAYFARTQGSAVVELLAVDGGSDTVILDVPGDPHAHRAMLAADGLLFVAFIDQVKVQFRARSARAITHDDAPALAVALPEALMRLQRRDFYRIRIPATDSTTCTVPYAGEHARLGDPVYFAKLRVFDISLSGMSLVVQQERQLPSVGKQLDHCMLDLPSVGRFEVSLQVRRITPMLRQLPARLVGCRFAILPPQGRQWIQRYIHRLGGGQLRQAADGD